METPNSIVIKKETNGNILITPEGAQYTVMSNSTISKGIDRVVVRQLMTQAPSIVFTVAAVEKVIHSNGTEVLISDVDTLFSELNTFFFFELEGGNTPAFNPSTDIVVDRVLEAVSLSASQEPAGLGIANAIQVEFGAAQFTGSDPVMMDVNGTVTFNVAGMYRVKSVFQFGRTGGAGTSEVLFRLLVNGVQLGRSVGVKLGNADVLNYIDIDNWFNVPTPGTILTTEIMRDNSGNNSGGIFKTTPTNEGAGTWGDVPCTILRIERWKSP